MNKENFDELLSMPWRDQVLSLVSRGAGDRFIRALIRTHPEEEWSSLREDAPEAVYFAMDTLRWEKRGSASWYDVPEQPQYRPVDELLADLNGIGRKQVARKELQVRLPYLTAYEQKQVIYTFLDTEVKTDRLFVLKYLYKHYDSQYSEAVRTVWELFHDFEAAKILTRFAPFEFVSENFEQLVSDYRYLPVRLRMPSSFPVDRSQLEMHEFLYLCARQQLSITEEEAFACLSNTIHRQIDREGFYYDNSSLSTLTFIPSILWSLGELGFQNLIIRFYLEDERTKQLFHPGFRSNAAPLIKSQLIEDDFIVFREILHTKEEAGEAEEISGGEEQVKVEMC